MSDNENGIWVTSDVTYDGHYTAAVHVDDDHTVTLNKASAYAYATTVLAAAERADYDAAVAAQMAGKLGIPKDVVGQVVAELRNDRPPLADAATAPLRLQPGVSAKTGEPFLALFIGTTQIGQWDPTDARQHAMHVLAAIEAVELDKAYRRYLVDKIGIGPDRALNAIANLANFRHAAPGGS